jgi:hypothetical protein
MIQERKLKNKRARNIGIMMGINQEDHCEMLFPRGFQEFLRGIATGGSH